jgi:hypothetical protein
MLTYALDNVENLSKEMEHTLRPHTLVAQGLIH